VATQIHKLKGGAKNQRKTGGRGDCDFFDELGREVLLLAIHFDEWGRGWGRCNYSITQGAYYLAPCVMGQNNQQKFGREGQLPRCLIVELHPVQCKPHNRPMQKQ